jgi:hypothetical protein
MDSLLLRHDASVAATHRLPSFAPRRTHAPSIAAGTLALAGLLASQAWGYTPWGRHPRPVVQPSRPAAPAPVVASADGVTEPTLAATLCAIKSSIRWRASAWSPAVCHQVAGAVISAANKHHLSPGLILGVMINESDLDETSVTKYRKGGAFYAQDSGLMGVRCVYDGHGRCNNGVVRGLTAADTRDVTRNIELGTQILALARKDGVEKRVTRIRTEDGQLLTTTRLVRCRHANHAFWAHYNHGSFYIARGEARHYPHRVAVLYYALAQSLGLPHDELMNRPLTITDPGRRPRTADHPVEVRFRTLVDKIYTATGLRTHSTTALASLAPRS